MSPIDMTGWEPMAELKATFIFVGDALRALERGDLGTVKHRLELLHSNLDIVLHPEEFSR